MNNLFKSMILNVRWGNQVTEEDRILVEYMTLFQLLGSSFITPKSSVTLDIVKRNKKRTTIKYI